jgi:gluconate 2-dehydrogenase gamma chain
MYLTSLERATLEAIVQRILPSGNGAGAHEANVMGYVDWVMQQEFFRPHYRRITTGLGFVDSIATRLWQKKFVSCSAEEQDAVLRTVETLPNSSSKRFMMTMVNMSLAGFLCDPKYGGNRNLVGWNYIGFELKGTSPALD